MVGAVVEGPVRCLAVEEQRVALARRDAEPGTMADASELLLPGAGREPRPPPRLAAGLQPAAAARRGRGGVGAREGGLAAGGDVGEEEKDRGKPVGSAAPWVPVMVLGRTERGPLQREVVVVPDVGLPRLVPQRLGIAKTRC